MDIWTEMARPAIELIAPHLRQGAVVIADNTTQVRRAYGPFFEFVEDPKNGLKTMTFYWYRRTGIHRPGSGAPVIAATRP